VAREDAVRSRSKARLASVAIGILLAALIASDAVGAPAAVIVPLRFTPKVKLEELGPRSGPVQQVPFSVSELIDSRSGDPSALGQNREHPVPVDVVAEGSFPAFATEGLRNCLGKWGAQIAPTGRLTLAGEILSVEVLEDNRYRARIAFRFILSTSDGRVSWEGRIEGVADRRGRSLKAENYNEVMSDALVKAYSLLVSDAGFQAALEGRSPTQESRASLAQGEPLSRQNGSIDPGDAEAELLKLRGAGLDEAFLIDFAAGLHLSRGLAASEVLAWREAGIPDTVIRVVISGGRPLSPVHADAASSKGAASSNQRAQAKPTPSVAATPKKPAQPGVETTFVPMLLPGFLDLSWGVSPAAGMSRMSGEGQLSGYRREPELRSIGNITVISVNWQFWQEKLFRVEITLPAESADRLVSTLSSAWGPPDPSRGPDVKASWSKTFETGAACVADVRTLPSGTSLRIFHPARAAEVDISRQAKEDL